MSLRRRTTIVLAAVALVSAAAATAPAPAAPGSGRAVAAATPTAPRRGGPGLRLPGRRPGQKAGARRLPAGGRQTLHGLEQLEPAVDQLSGRQPRRARKLHQ